MAAKVSEAHVVGLSTHDSAYEWRLRAVGNGQGRSVTLAQGKHCELPTDLSAIVVTGHALRRNIDNTEFFRNLVGPTYPLGGTNNDTLVAEVSFDT
jgi:hypothetical protein